MAQTWAVASLALAGAAPFVAYNYQNEYAHFLWPQIPEGARPYPGGILLEHAPAPTNNHSLWGIYAYPIALVGSYYPLKYTLGALLNLYIRMRFRHGKGTPLQMMTPTGTLKYKAPQIVQSCIPAAMAINFAMLAKVFRDGPGLQYDPEFYRTGERSNRWNWLDYSNPEHDTQNWIPQDSAYQLLNITARSDPRDSNLLEDPFPDTVSNPSSESLETRSFIAWKNADLGYNPQTARQMDKEWKKIDPLYDSRLDEDEPVVIQAPNGQIILAHEEQLKAQKKLEEQQRVSIIGEWDSSNPIGQVPTLGVMMGGDNITYNDLSPKRKFPTQKAFLEAHDKKGDMFTPTVELKTLREDAHSITRDALDAVMGPYKTPGVVNMDEFSLEKRIMKRAESKDRADTHSWEGYYYHENSIIGRPHPSGLRLSADAWSHGKVFSNQQEYDEEKERKEYEKQNLYKPLELAEISKPFINQAQQHLSLTKAKHREHLLNRVSTANRLEQDHQEFIRPQNLPGYERQWLGTQRHVDFLQRKVDLAEHRGHTHDHEMPDFQKGIYEHRHDYYTGRGATYSSQPNLLTKKMAYDPNVVPAPPSNLELGWDQTQEWYKRMEQIDYDHARKAAGSFKRKYGIAFPKFEEPNLHQEHMIQKYPHLRRQNERVTSDVKYINSLEKRLLNPPNYDSYRTSQHYLDQPDYILDNDFNPALYKDSLQYRQRWDEKYPGFKSSSSTDSNDLARAKHTERLLAESYGQEQWKKRIGEVRSGREDPWNQRNNNTQLFLNDPNTDRWTERLVDRKYSKPEKVPELTMVGYPTKESAKRKELFPPNLLNGKENERDNHYRRLPNGDNGPGHIASARHTNRAPYPTVGGYEDQKTQYNNIMNEEPPYVWDEKKYGEKRDREQQKRVTNQPLSNINPEWGQTMSGPQRKYEWGDKNKKEQDESKNPNNKPGR